MKVLQVISSGGLYGAEAVLLTLSTTLNQASHKSTLAIFNNLPKPNLEVHEKALLLGMESNLIPCSGQVDYKAISNLRNLIQTTGADVVHAHGYKADIYVYLALRGSTIPIVSTCHNWIKHSWLVSAYGAVDRLILRNYSAVVAVSEDVKRILVESRVDLDKIYLIRNGIDVESFLNVAPSLREDRDTTMIGWVGRLSHEKGPDIFIRAAAQVLRECPDLVFVLVGDGPLRADLEALANELEISANVRFMGRREDMAAVYASIDLLVSSSRQEGLPMSILEGMASGVPWVATAVGDVPTLIKNGHNGLLVSIEDIEGLASGVLRLATNPYIRKQFGLAARQTVQNDFSTQRMTGEYVALYEKLIAATTDSPRVRKVQNFESGRSSAARPRVFMMDLSATVPYYTAYLAKALLGENIDLQVGSTTYYLDRNCFSERGISLDPGLINVVGRFNLSAVPRRIFKIVELFLNLVALTVRFAIKPPDVVHVQYLALLRWRCPIEVWFLKFCRLRGSKLVLTIHDLLPHDTAQRYKATFQKLYLTCDGVICHSNHIEERLIEEFSIRREIIAIIPHGPFFYDMEGTEDRLSLESIGANSSDTLVLWQGIIFPYKGLDLLLGEWQKVEEQDLQTFLLIAGTGSAAVLSQIRDSVRLLGLKKVGLCLRFISPEELVSFYRAADIVVYPYRHITTSGALATGLALGKTIIASDLPVFRELLCNRENALLFDLKRSSSLSEAIIELVRDPALRNSLSENVKTLNFGDESWRHIARETMKVYSRQLRSK